jgi:hypothetical protein
MGHSVVLGGGIVLYPALKTVPQGLLIRPDWIATDQAAEKSKCRSFDCVWRQERAKLRSG